MLELILVAALAQPDMGAHTQHMIDAQPPPMVAWDCYDPVEVWLVPNGDGYIVCLMHPCRVCCFESYVPVPDSFAWWYYPLPVMPLFNPGYRILDLPDDHTSYPECQHQGQQFASYPLGDMEDSLNAPVGWWEGPLPIVFGHNPGCAVGAADIVVYSGVTPNWPLPVTLRLTGHGDADGDGVVGVMDFLYELEYWSAFGIETVLDTLAHWGAAYP